MRQIKRHMIVASVRRLINNLEINMKIRAYDLEFLIARYEKISSSNKITVFLVQGNTMILFKIIRPYAVRRFYLIQKRPTKKTWM